MTNVKQKSKGLVRIELSQKYRRESRRRKSAGSHRTAAAFAQWLMESVASLGFSGQKQRGTRQSHLESAAARLCVTGV